MRSFSVTVRDQNSVPLPNVRVCVNDVCNYTQGNGRVRIGNISEDWHQVQLSISSETHGDWSNSVNIDKDSWPNGPFGHVDWEDIYLGGAVNKSSLSIRGDKFYLNGKLWIWKGSTEFRLPELCHRALDIKPILKDRKSAGANLVRILSMKKNNTGYRFDPRSPGHRAALKRTFDEIGNMGMFCECCYFADTGEMMSDFQEQQRYDAELDEILIKYPFVVKELLNEDKHGTQKIESKAFNKPTGILSSHGSGLSDTQPVKPLWDFATYHARRTPPPPNAKPFNNLNPYEFHPEWPHPVPYVCEEFVKPENYGYNVDYARQLGLAAKLGPGATFHHSAWLEERPFNDAERACAHAFFEALS